jgi:ubiquinone biosynthesis protein COQ9
LQYFIDQCNNKLAKEVEEEGTAFSELSTKDKLVQAIRLRLEMQAPYVTTWPQALALQVSY